MRHLLLPLILLVAACAGQGGQVADAYPPPQAPAEATATIDSVIAEAGASGKLAMLVLGANWCHDSRDFARMVEKPALAEWLDQYYVIGLFNLGYLDHMQTYLEPFDVPVLYGTPTVLVVDPKTGQLLNPDLHYYWRNASLLDAEDARTYFAVYLTPREEPAALSAELAAALVRIDRFEVNQARRISQAYAVLGPMMVLYEQGSPPADFDDKWSNLAKMRGQITDDLQALRQSAREQDAAGVSPIELEFPSYPLFID